MKQNINQTLKSSDTEEFIDIYFYRKIGYWVAKLSADLGIKPNTITIISIFWGIIAGHLMMYETFWINLIGVLSLIIANILDSADGQLARMTNNKTRLGRILDGLAGNIWFVSIYIHLGIRMQGEGMGNWIWLLGAITGLCHVFQAAIADYYRNGHLFFIKGDIGSEFDNSKEMKDVYNNLSWKTDFFYKFFMKSYINYTKEQELFTRNLGRLITMVRKEFPMGIPHELMIGFRTDNLPLMKFTNILSFNTRAIALFVAVLSGFPIAYWIFEITVLNIILIYMVLQQEQISKKYIELLNVNSTTTGYNEK